MHLLFVDGALKEGLPNFHVNKGRRVPGMYRTLQPCPQFLANGQHVEGNPARSHDVFVDVPHASRLAGSAAAVGPMAEYTREHAKSLHW